MADISWPNRNTPALPMGGGTGGGNHLSLRSLAACEPFLAVAGIGAWMYEAGGRLWWSAETRRIHGVAADFTPSRDAAISFYAPEARAEISAALEAAILDGAPWDLELPIVRADGQSRRVRARGRRVDARACAPVMVMGTFEDVTARHESAARAAHELALRARTETLLRDVIAGIPAALSVYDHDERLILVNDSYRGLLPGNETLMIKGERLADIITRKVMADHYVPEVSASDPPEVRRAWVSDYLRRHRSNGYARIFHLKNDKWMQASTAMSTSGNIVSIRTDITPLMRAERELRRRAEEDSLTGLANREMLLAGLEGLATGGRSGLVVLLDVDFFKAVNDGLGHAAGDLLLRLTGRRLQRCLRDGDTAARLAGDEFALIVHGPKQPAEIQGFLSRLMTTLRRPMRLGANRYGPSVSIGVTAFPAPGANAKTLLANADAALYEAKRQGRARATVFDASLAARVVRRTRLADQLRRAISERRLVAALQPQQRVSDGGVMGFEALARWQQDGVWVSPAEFVAIAEETGLAQPLGLQVMDSAMAGFAAMLATGLEPGHLAVNVSTAQLLSDDFLETVKRLLARHGLPAGRLEVEVTETVLLDRSIARIGQTLEALRALGVSLAMDDFGTGYASLSHLTSFPVDRIKIDQSFTKAIGECGDKGLIARTLIGLGKGLGLEVIAEGVETEQQRQFLVNHGCSGIQGYLFARPMLADDALRWLAAKPRVARNRSFGILRSGSR
ncbi:EAL domain-containing protein [Sandarakinorhabdus sp.]|uniref:putative bifunctional diguanylate cyclase/phosphodiesterase n=1 Tax=Sandarakinorhabdus sp. TaxID=1916663 RepID=UPI00286D703C|nr:EAL domain-containing protein [Sandarakinorhabdus sp.]